MRSMRNKKARRVLRLPDLDYAKRAVLNRLGSAESKRAYQFASMISSVVSTTPVSGLTDTFNSA